MLDLGYSNIKKFKYEKTPFMCLNGMKIPRKTAWE